MNCLPAQSGNLTGNVEEVREFIENRIPNVQELGLKFPSGSPADVGVRTRQETSATGFAVPSISTGEDFIDPRKSSDVVTATVEAQNKLTAGKM